MPYTIRKGVLYHDGRAQIALGQSYYPSYHPQKVPVPPTGDRLGEMAKDLRAMREAGFNVVRMAALGDVTYDQGKVSVDFPLPDAFCRMCEEQDLGAMIRLQGYSMNLRNFPDATMVDQQGQPMENAWSWFIRNCVNHPGIIEDNRMGTRASAAHFAAFPAVCSFQIYNEPAYPNLGLYDYHPETLRAYAAWRAEHGLPPQEAPRSRPAPKEDASGWVAWRTFLRERLNGFLCDMAAQAKAGYDAPATLTCHMSCPLVPGATVRGEDYYTTAQGMDILGITCYLVNRGPAFHQAAMTLDACESAAACFGKKAWLIEYNARTDMPPQEWPRETYAALGRGFKGIFYYQWRADLPYPDGPEPEQFGMLYSDGRKASSYDMGVRMNRLVNRLSRAPGGSGEGPQRRGAAVLRRGQRLLRRPGQPGRAGYRPMRRTEHPGPAPLLYPAQPAGIDGGFPAAPGAGRESPGHPGADSPLPPGTARGGTGADRGLPGIWRPGIRIPGRGAGLPALCPGAASGGPRRGHRAVRRFRPVRPGKSSPRPAPHGLPWGCGRAAAAGQGRRLGRADQL